METPPLISPLSAEYWEEQARLLTWFNPHEHLVEGNIPDSRWFTGGRLNASVNCLDRHMGTPTWQARALIWEGEDGDVRTLTYADVAVHVNRCANALRAAGIQKGDRVAIYMGLVPEAIVAMLACARIGAVHMVVFGGFGTDALAKRIQDTGCKLVFTCDGAYRRGKVVPLKAMVDDILEICPTVERVVVFRRVSDASFNASMRSDADISWDDFLCGDGDAAEPEEMDAEDLLFILHTSGTTGMPKGIMHSTAGYLVGAASTFKRLFAREDGGVYWCTADIGWITGHSYVVYGPLMNGATVLLYEGALDYPEPDRVWGLCEKHRVEVLYTAPTAIRSFMHSGPDLPARHDLSALRLLGSVGEPIDPEAWRWYHDVVGNGRCRILDTWWQTETGAIMIAPSPRDESQKPGCVSHPLPGIIAEAVGEDGAPVGPEEQGYLVIREPWPSMLRGIWNHRERFLSTYFEQVPGSYFTHDRCRIDLDGDFWMLGRDDDIIISSGHNISNVEVERVLTEHAACSEAAVIGIPDPICGQRIVAFMVLRADILWSDDLFADFSQHVSRRMSPTVKPKAYFVVPEIPKTRSGKVMRRLFRNLLIGEPVGDTSSLVNNEVVEEIKRAIERMKRSESV